MHARGAEPPVPPRRFVVATFAAVLVLFAGGVAVGTVMPALGAGTPRTAPRAVVSEYLSAYRDGQPDRSRTYLCRAARSEIRLSPVERAAAGRLSWAIRAERIDDHRAEVDVDLSFRSGGDVPVTFVLVDEGRGWKVCDVTERS